MRMKPHHCSSEGHAKWRYINSPELGFPVYTEMLQASRERRREAGACGVLFDFWVPVWAFFHFCCDATEDLRVLHVFRSFFVYERNVLELDSTIGGVVERRGGFGVGIRYSWNEFKRTEAMMRGRSLALQLVPPVAEFFFTYWQAWENLMIIFWLVAELVIVLLLFHVFAEPCVSCNDWLKKLSGELKFLDILLLDVYLSSPLHCDFTCFYEHFFDQRIG